jgi:tRNA dimethylallyltransferase
MPAKVLFLFLMGTGIKPDIDLLAIVGHTAGGKTALAAAVAHALGGEVICADSRQIYRGMDLGTGKDYGDYMVDGELVPSHLMDIRDAGERYSLFDFQEDFRRVYSDILQRRKLPVLCGGTGMYVESVLRDFHLKSVPVDEKFRQSCESRPDAELSRELGSMVPLHNKTDIEDRTRLIRALEIARYNQTHPEAENQNKLKFRVFGVRYDVEERRKRITQRLKQRLDSGMIDEVKQLLTHVSPDSLMYYGLEYKYLTLYCLGRLTYEEMFSQLNTAIHQFAKRQMTWFRGMERRGITITWVAGEWTLSRKIDFVLDNRLAGAR